MCWIKINRKLLEWEWHDKPEMMSFWIHLLMMANYEDRRWHGTEIMRGSFVTSLQSLSDIVGISVKQARNYMGKLEDTGEIELKRTNKYTIVTICKYDTYQVQESEEGKQRADKGQTKGTQRATTKEIKKERNIEENIPSGIEKKIEEVEAEASTERCRKQAEKKEYAQRVHLTEKEYSTLVSKYGEPDTRWMIEKLSAYKTSRNKTYASDYGAINSWVVDRLKEEKAKGLTSKTNYSNENYW